MNDEQMTILRMVSAGKVTAEEAEQLLRALKGPTTGPKPPATEMRDDFFERGTFDVDAGPTAFEVPEGTKLIVQGNLGPVVVVGTDEPELQVLGPPNQYEVDREEGLVRISARRLDAPVTVHAPRTVVGVHASSQTERVAVENLRADIEARTEAGDIVVRRIEGAVKATTEAGAITLSEVASSDVQARLTAGDLSVDLGAFMEGTVKLRAQAGTVELRVPPEAAFDLSAVVNEIGDVDTDLPLDIAQQGPGYLQGALNGGGAMVQIAVDTGNIHIRSKGDANDE